MDTYFKNILKQKSQPEKIEFQKRIIKTNYPNLGIPTLELRKLSKTFSLIQIPTTNFYYDELLLYGFSIAYSKKPLSHKYELIQRYIDLADCWALIDSFCSSFNLNKTELEQTYPFLLENFNSDMEFRRRFALVMFLNHYVKRDKDLRKIPRLKSVDLKDLKIENETLSLYFENILNLINSKFSDYYVSMAAAWLLCEMFLVNPKRIFEFLQDNHLDDLTFNRTIDKIIQSKVPSPEVKETIKKLKRKNVE